MKYLIEYGPTKEYSPPQILPPPILTSSPSPAKTDVVELTLNPPSKSSKDNLGLISNSGKALPLKSVMVKATILDLASEVVVFQKFRNESGNFLASFLFHKYICTLWPFFIDYFLFIYVYLLFYFIFSSPPPPKISLSMLAHYITLVHHFLKISQ